MKAELVASNLLKLPVSIGTPVFVVKEGMEAILVEYSLNDIHEDVYLSRADAETKGLKVIKCSRK